jgi:hypothetical protein
MTGDQKKKRETEQTYCKQAQSILAIPNPDNRDRRKKRRVRFVVQSVYKLERGIKLPLMSKHSVTLSIGG